MYIDSEHVLRGGGGGDERRPEPEPGKRRARPSRGTVGTVAVVTILVAVIALANGAGKNEGQAANSPSPSATVSDDKPLAPAAGFQSRAGAEQAATHYAEQLGSVDMFNQERRHALIRSVAVADRQTTLISEFDRAYTPQLNERIGLTAKGEAPEGQSFINQTMPARSTVTEYQGSRATVEVWCSGSFGFTGQHVTQPVETNYFTLTINLVWNGTAWKFYDSKQTEGPTPN
ncbi:hypothetical protein [Streptomyces sp. VN1]|uniref:hypothetical protein n=1 Tax=Streptomyces sp. VN1 TaxID=1821625 RepID=UPI001413E38F|nr:hypothetical protein [Streptomyces sp. VN1]QIP74751.1 hypothetical protein EZV63_36990 [Streptomyces sp. VN1]